MSDNEPKKGEVPAPQFEDEPAGYQRALEEEAGE
jgi:hypothetical protein